jgi:hypothetical protein
VTIASMGRRPGVVVAIIQRHRVLRGRALPTCDTLQISGTMAHACTWAVAGMYANLPTAVSVIITGTR